MTVSRGRATLAAAVLAGVVTAGTATRAETAFEAPNENTRVLGGWAAGADWPSFARVLVQKGTTSSLCGGTVIGKRWVMTAAHCVVGASAKAILILEVGASPLAPARRLDVDRVEIPDSYRVDKYAAPHDDIALLHLTGLANSPAQRLLPRSRVDSVVVAGADSEAAGYGLTTPQTASGPHVGAAASRLLETRIPIVGRRVCRTRVNREFGGPVLDEGHICAADLARASADTCPGDSGGPLAMEVDGRQTQIGVTSFGAGCGQRGAPGVYTSVGHFEPWIRHIVADSDFGERRVAQAGPPSPTEAPPARDCGLPEAGDDGLTVGLAETNRPRIGADIHVRVTSHRPGDLVVLNVDLATCKIFRVAPQPSYAPRAHATGTGSVFFPPLDAEKGIKVTGPAGRNRLIAAVLPEGVSADSFVSASPRSSELADVGAILARLRKQALAFGSHDYEIVE